MSGDLRHRASGGRSQLQCRRLQMPVHVSHLRPLERPRHQAPQLPQTGCAPGLLHSDSSPESSEVTELPAPLTKSPKSPKSPKSTKSPKSPKSTKTNGSTRVGGGTTPVNLHSPGHKRISFGFYDSRASTSETGRVRTSPCPWEAYHSSPERAPSRLAI